MGFIINEFYISNKSFSGAYFSKFAWEEKFDKTVLKILFMRSVHKIGPLSESELLEIREFEVR